jgi:hypothetical protein
MRKTNPVAIGQIVLAAPSAGGRTDDDLRRLAAERLAEHLDIGASLIARCEALAQSPGADMLGSINAAARLMRANAFVAEALANVAQVERRRRSIVERIQPPDPRLAELNAQKEKTNRRLLLYDKMERLLQSDIQSGKRPPYTPEEQAGADRFRQKLIDDFENDGEEAGV